MEFDIGTLIYILITIIAIVAGVAGQKKKPAKGTAAPDSGGENESRGFFDKLEEQLGGFMDETKEKVQNFSDEILYQEKRSEPVMQEGVSNYNDRMMEVDYDEDNEIYQNAYNAFEGVLDPDKQENLELITEEAIRTTEESEVLQVIEMDNMSHPDYYEIVREFDLGTAVIYSTIINRPDY